MSELTVYRTKIDERAALLEPLLGLDIFENLFGLQREQAIAWIKKQGDPTETPAAAVLLA